MTGRRWCVSIQVDGEGDTSVMGLFDVEHDKLLDCLSDAMDTPNLLTITLFAKESKASVLSHLRQHFGAISLSDHGAVN